MNWSPWRVKKLTFWGLALLQSYVEALTKGQCFRCQLLNSLWWTLGSQESCCVSNIIIIWLFAPWFWFMFRWDKVFVDDVVLVSFFFINGMVCWWNTSLTCSYLCCTGIKESDTGLAPPALWDLAADKQTLQGEQPLQVHYIIWKL